MKSSAPPRILVFASINLDLTLNIDRLPHLGETVLARESLACPGGKGANQAVAAKRLGAEIGIVCCVGDDLPGQALRAAIEAEGIEIVGWHVDPGQPTGLASISVLPDGQNAIVVASGANASLSPAHVREAFLKGGDWDCVMTTLESPRQVAEHAAMEGHRRGVPCHLDVGGNPLATRAMATNAFFPVSGNEGEVGLMHGGATFHDADEILAAIRGRHPWIIVKMGASGSLSESEFGEPVVVPGFRVEVVDTVGAGDAHSAGTVVAALEGAGEDGPADWTDHCRRVLRFANAAGALACTATGAFPAMPTRAEVEKLLKEQPTG